MLTFLINLCRSGSLEGILAVLAGLAARLRILDPTAALFASRLERALADLQSLLARFKAGELPPETPNAPTPSRPGTATPQPRPREAAARPYAARAPRETADAPEPPALAPIPPILIIRMPRRRRPRRAIRISPAAPISKFGRS